MLSGMEDKKKGYILALLSIKMSIQNDMTAWLGANITLVYLVNNKNKAS